MYLKKKHAKKLYGIATKDDPGNDSDNDLASPISPKDGTSRGPSSRAVRNEIKNIGQYKVLGVIGKGSFGKVYKCFDQETGATVAIKRVSLHGANAEEVETILIEIKLLEGLQHPNIVRYIGAVHEPETNHLSVVLEYVESGQLSSLFGPDGHPSESLVAKYTQQILTGVCYLHSQGVIHRDIKSANILSDKDGVIKLTDFGVATKLIEAALSTGSASGHSAGSNSTVSGSSASSGSSGANNSASGNAENGGEESLSGTSNRRGGGVDQTTVKAFTTPFWMAPEVIEMKDQSTACDIWSIGCTVIELLTGKPPYYDLSPMQAMYHIVQDLHPPLPDTISPELKEFLLQCFVKDSNTRIEAARLSLHPWITRGLPPPIVVAGIGGGNSPNAKKQATSNNDERGSVPASTDDAMRGSGSGNLAINIDGKEAEAVAKRDAVQRTIADIIRRIHASGAKEVEVLQSLVDLGGMLAGPEAQLVRDILKNSQGVSHLVEVMYIYSTGDDLRQPCEAIVQAALVVANQFLSVRLLNQESQAVVVSQFLAVGLVDRLIACNDALHDGTIQAMSAALLRTCCFMSPFPFIVAGGVRALAALIQLTSESHELRVLRTALDCLDHLLHSPAKVCHPITANDLCRLIGSSELGTVPLLLSALEDLNQNHNPSNISAATSGKKGKKKNIQFHVVPPTAIAAGNTSPSNISGTSANSLASNVKKSASSNNMSSLTLTIGKSKDKHNQNLAMAAKYAALTAVSGFNTQDPLDMVLADFPHSPLPSPQLVRATSNSGNSQPAAAATGGAGGPAGGKYRNSLSSHTSSNNLSSLDGGANANNNNNNSSTLTALTINLSASDGTTAGSGGGSGGAGGSATSGGAVAVTNRPVLPGMSGKNGVVVMMQLIAKILNTLARGPLAVQQMFCTKDRIDALLSVAGTCRELSAALPLCNTFAVLMSYPNILSRIQTVSAVDPSIALNGLVSLLSQVQDSPLPAHITQAMSDWAIADCLHGILQLTRDEDEEVLFPFSNPAAAANSSSSSSPSNANSNNTTHLQCAVEQTELIIQLDRLLSSQRVSLLSSSPTLSSLSSSAVLAITIEPSSPAPVVVVGRKHHGASVTSEGAHFSLDDNSPLILGDARVLGTFNIAEYLPRFLFPILYRAAMDEMGGTREKVQSGLNPQNLAQFLSHPYYGPPTLEVLVEWVHDISNRGAVSTSSEREKEKEKEREREKEKKMLHKEKEKRNSDSRNNSQHNSKVFNYMNNNSYGILAPMDVEEFLISDGCLEDIVSLLGVHIVTRVQYVKLLKDLQKLFSASSGFNQRLSKHPGFTRELITALKTQGPLHGQIKIEVLKVLHWLASQNHNYAFTPQLVEELKPLTEDRMVIIQSLAKALLHLFLDREEEGDGHREEKVVVVRKKVKNCMVCQRKFGLLVRKQICTHCQFVVCAKCSPSIPVVTGAVSSPGPGGAQTRRVCKNCASFLTTEDLDGLDSTKTLPKKFVK